MPESRAPRDISVSKQRPTQSRSVGPSISDAVGAHRFSDTCRLAADFGKFIAIEAEKWSKVIRAPVSKLSKGIATRSSGGREWRKRQSHDRVVTVAFVKRLVKDIQIMRGKYAM